MERNSLNWAKGRGLSKKSYFPDCVSKPGFQHIIGCQAANFALGRGAKFGPRNIDEVCQDQSRSFHNWSFWESNRWLPHFTNRGNHQILSQKDPLQAVGLLLWLGGRRHWCRGRKYYICPEPLYKPPNYPPKLGCQTLALQYQID